MKLICIPPDQVETFWPSTWKYILTALSNVGLTEVLDIRKRLANAEALLWVATDGTCIAGAGVTELVTSYNQKICDIVAWSTDSHNNALLKTIEDFARAEGCSKVRLIGRKGWAKRLPEFKLKAVIMEKAL